MVYSANARTVDLGGQGHVGGRLDEPLRKTGFFGLRAPRLALFETKQPATRKPKPDKR